MKGRYLVVLMLAAVLFAVWAPISGLFTSETKNPAEIVVETLIAGNPSTSVSPVIPATETETPVPVDTATSFPTLTMVPTPTPLPVFEIGAEELRVMQRGFAGDCGSNITWETVESCFVKSDEDLVPGEVVLLVTLRESDSYYSFGGGAHTTMYNFLMIQKPEKWPDELKRYVYPNKREANLFMCWEESKDLALQLNLINEVPAAYTDWRVAYVAVIPISDRAALRLNADGVDSVYYLPLDNENDWVGKIQDCINFQNTQSPVPFIP